VTPSAGPLCRYFHLSGSASRKTDPKLIRYAHRLVAEIAKTIVLSGGGLVLGAGKEPLQSNELPDAPSLIFDWTALEAAANVLLARDSAAATFVPSIVVVLSEKAESEIPAPRKELWRALVSSGQVRVEYIQPGARSGAMIRDRQAQFGDVLVCLGGGSGVEHLAETYMVRRKSIIPFDLAIGASREDGTGGASMLNRVAHANPTDYLLLIPEKQGSGASLLSLLDTESGRRDIAEIIANFSNLLSVLDRPTAFYVRLLNSEHPDFNEVEAFFRNVVDPVVDNLGFRRIEMGIDRSQYGFMNVEIFETLHYASVAIVDITSHRENCFIELGYALGRTLRVIVTARVGTPLPFDQQAIPCFFWNSPSGHDDLRQGLSTFIDRKLNRSPLVR
jgi:hypothetical protein